MRPIYNRQEAGGGSAAFTLKTLHDAPMALRARKKGATRRSRRGRTQRYGLWQE